MTGYRRVNLKERPDLARPAQHLIGSVWPEFMLHDPTADQYWDSLFDDFPEFQFVLLDESDNIVAVGNSIPIAWNDSFQMLPDTGWDWALSQGVQGHREGRAPTLLSALSASIASTHQGQGLSPQVVNGMREIAISAGLQALVAPVRPSLKSRYPLIPMERYARWEGPEGLPFDPWLRVHARLGAQIIRVAPQSMTITGTVADWESWTGMRLPESGDYVIPGGLEPVNIQWEQNQGTYIEPNVWMLHTYEHSSLR